MALGDARRRARDEFETALQRTGRSLNAFYDYVRRYPELRDPFLDFRQPGLAGTAAQFLHYVASRMEQHR